MSETSIKNNPAIACGEMKDQEAKGITIEQGTYGPSKNEINRLAGMEIQVEGYEIVFDEKTGKLLRIKNNKTIGEITEDRRKRKIMDALGKKEADKEQR